MSQSFTFRSLPFRLNSKRPRPPWTTLFALVSRLRSISKRLMDVLPICPPSTTTLPRSRTSLKLNSPLPRPISMRSPRNCTLLMSALTAR
ncbi:hypothetical protein TELCIR_26010 [Teladorsagia circumcincta]|uniref:Uncharacterized protein n=1 Tax=Teladorsagia circumcincta TaxID=45464 RepID=A0A2G9T559_TELCI|nr:hypothetical protein TELCIR_26010 [Teladorsagia circumcincta]